MSGPDVLIEPPAHLQAPVEPKPGTADIPMPGIAKFAEALVMQLAGLHAEMRAELGRMRAEGDRARETRERMDAANSEASRIARELAVRQDDLGRMIEVQRVLLRQMRMENDRRVALDRVDAERRRRELGITSADMDATR